MKELEESKKMTWQELREFCQSLSPHITDEEFVAMDKAFSRLDLTSIPDDVGFQDKEFEAKVDAAKAEKARQEGR